MAGGSAQAEKELLSDKEGEGLGEDEEEEEVREKSIYLPSIGEERVETRTAMI